ncbi:TLC domain-containing protein [Meloidogyne graminicola]|uniref:TLC domain-containing protein n=1 Tax=Meloidogyne graminicola TaxID=189291 RepID=A0A8S9ZLF7_9BILA|nr:TLC domain-containing protein [Meloidogyne graminicola]
MNMQNLGSHSWVWSEQFWLPENVTWSNLRSKAGIQYPQFYEFGYTLLIGVLITLLRILVEAFLFVPVGYLSGWLDTKKATLLQRIQTHLFFGFAGRSKFKRVSETAWRFTYYLFISIAGIYILHDQPQFTSMAESFKNWPNHHLPNSVWWYYVIQTGFYWSLIFSILTFDVRRSDQYEMASHHLATIILLAMSFTVNFVRFGSLILLIHDSADIFLELGKLFRYAGWDKAVTIDFCLFMFVWILTRLVYFPFVMLRCMIFDGPTLIQESYRWGNLLQRPIVPRVFLFILCFLLILHLFWTYILLKIAIKSINNGVDDIREVSDAEEEETLQAKKAE